MSPVPPVRPALRYGLPALVALLTLAAFLPSLNGEFLNWDDDTNFLANPHYRGLGPANLRWMFTDYYCLYMPITWLTLGLDYVLWGMNPRGYHATSMILHALNAVLCFFLLRKLLVRAGIERGFEVAAAAGALAFSLHPMRVESVAWITERRDVTAGVFFFLTLLAYLRMTSEPPGRSRLKWLWLSVAAFAASLLSKTMGMTLPVALLVLDAVPLRRYSSEGLRRLLVEKVPFFVLMIAGAASTSYTQSLAGSIYSREGYPLIQSVAQPGYRISFYAIKTLLPLNLSPLYWYRPDLGTRQVLGWLAVAAISLVLFLRRRALPSSLAAWVAFLVLIAPVAGLVQAGPHFAADRYTYFAAIPFAALFAAAVARIPAPTALAAAAALLAGLGAMTARYSAFWKDSVTLWTRAVELDPDVYFTLHRRAEALAARGEWARALTDENRSLELNGGWFESWGGRARTRLALGDFAGAIADATHALELRPGWSEALNCRGVALSRLGRSREAIADFSGALKDRPQFTEARVHRANERAKAGDFDGSLADFDAAIDFDPQPRILARRGMTRAARGDLAGAAADFKRALETAPPGWSQKSQVEELLQRARSELRR